ncbi:glycosyltransferase family 2 protein [Pontibacter chinhatensis]|uniref:Glycosyl transferase family 2 n=1 Tax=Pontibacter chinhatensis TaxID=1436961 RepID=A0A1I2QWZ2_9BACT|nr:glycosyltransferase family A protein [Pontibacter chinhatensis]SFG32904.1 Glycosyl transferase family 2 [Pontibacter chinhatensis]
MKVSVIIPTFNRSTLIEKAVKDVIKQSYKDWELIIVDDGSTDDTEWVIRKYIDSDNRITYLKKGKTGAADSRNYGVKHATGEVVTFYDSDDELADNWMELMISGFSNPNICLVSCGVSTKDVIKDKEINRELPQKVWHCKRGTTAMFIAAAFFIKKIVFEQIGGYDIQLHSDQHTELGFRIIKYMGENNLQGNIIPHVLMQINVHGGARIRSNDKAVFLGTKRILTKHENILRTKKKKYIEYLEINAYRASKLGLKSEALSSIKKIIIYKPYYWKAWVKYILYNFR